MQKLLPAAKAGGADSAPASPDILRKSEQAATNPATNPESAQQSKRYPKNSVPLVEIKSRE